MYLWDNGHADVSHLDGVVFKGEPLRHAEVVEAKTSDYIDDVWGEEGGLILGCDSHNSLHALRSGYLHVVLALVIQIRCGGGTG